MIFSKQAILQAIEAGDLAVRPFSDDQVQNAHVDLHLSLAEGQQELRVKAGEFSLAKTLEKITTGAHICAFMEGKASLAKQGISIEQSSTFIEPGSDNQMMLEIFNASKQEVVLTQGQPIAKMIIMKTVERYSNS